MLILYILYILRCVCNLRYFGIMRSVEFHKKTALIIIKHVKKAAKCTRNPP